ncbi:MAG: fasciclin domain-containing protein [Phycisphaerae bacterium]|nr:fasciclin domain-containing protein [Phycisphaerae bacterium]
MAAAPAVAQCESSKKAECAATKQACGSQGEVAAMGVAFEQPADIVDTAVAAGSFKTLAAALKAAGLVETLKGKGPFTVFAPTDEAFAKLPAGTVEMLLKPENKEKLAGILAYHVVAGSVMAKEVVGLKTAGTVNGQRVDIMVKEGKVVLDGKSTVTKTDIACSNGVIHVIDTVIMPVSNDVVATAMEAGSFTTLAKALTAAGLVETLQGKGPFTVFAPTDEAFAKLPPGTIESLLKPENKEKLASILTFHVIPGRVYADQVVTMTRSAKTVQGQTFAISVKDGKVMIGNESAMAKVTATDVEASNGVIHVIDTVLMPK